MTPKEMKSDNNNELCELRQRIKELEALCASSISAFTVGDLLAEVNRRIK